MASVESLHCLSIVQTHETKIVTDKQCKNWFGWCWVWKNTAGKGHNFLFEAWHSVTVGWALSQRTGKNVGKNSLRLCCCQGIGFMTVDWYILQVPWHFDMTWARW